MRVTPLRLVPIPALVALLLTTAAPAAYSGDDPGEPKVVVVQRRALTTWLDLSGSFVPQGAVEVKYAPEVYGGRLEVVEAVDPGPVVAGQVLVRFDEETIRRDIKSRERDLYSARARLEKQKAEFRQKQVHTRLGRDRSERSLAYAELALKHFLEIHKPTRIARAEYNLEGTENRIKDTVEELEQLEKMYEADDLTEETEEIVIRRSRRGLARQRKSFEWAKQNHELFLEVTLPREQKDLEHNLEKARIDFETYKIASEADLRRAELDLDQAKDDFERAEKRMDELRADRDALRVRAPRDGYAVPGVFKGTGWSDIAGMRRVLTPKSTVKAGTVLYTIVKPGDVDILTSVGESDLARVKVGQAVTVRPAIDKEKALDAVVTEVLHVGQGGKYAVALDLRETLKALMPGMSCKLKIAVRRVEDALVLPKTAMRQVNKEGLFVYVSKNGKTEARKIETGVEENGRVEILSGVKEGESVLATVPEEKEKK